MKRNHYPYREILCILLCLKTTKSNLSSGYHGILLHSNVKPYVTSVYNTYQLE